MPKEEACGVWLLVGNTRGGVERPTCQSRDRCVEKTNHDRAAREPAVWAEGPEPAEAIAAQGQLRRDVHALLQDHSEYAPLPAHASRLVQTFPAQPRIHRG